MIKDIKNINKIVGNMLVRQSGLDRSRIINGHSVRGVNLSKFVTDNVKLSYNLSDSVIIFEIDPANNDDVNITEESESGNIRQFVYVEVKVIIYGQEASILAKTLKARIESEEVRNDLLLQEVYMSKVKDIVVVNDFINETIWPRADFSINLAYEIEITKIDSFEDMTQTQNIITQSLEDSL